MRFLKVLLLITTISFLFIACGSSSNSSNNGPSAKGINEIIIPDDDNDNDGIPDENDKCDETPAGMAVTEVGCTAQQTKERAIALLTDGDIEAAIAYIKESLIYFASDNELACDGLKTFNAERKAIKELLKIDDPVVDEVIASLVKADTLLAEIAIADSVCGLGCTEKAEALFAEAISVEDANDAIALFGKAWKKAINCVCEGFDGDSDGDSDPESDSESDPNIDSDSDSDSDYAGDDECEEDSDSDSNEDY